MLRPQVREVPRPLSRRRMRSHQCVTDPPSRTPASAVRRPVVTRRAAAAAESSRSRRRLDSHRRAWPARASIGIQARRSRAIWTTFSDELLQRPGRRAREHHQPPGLVREGHGQLLEEATAELRALGVTSVRTDRVRGTVAERETAAFRTRPNCAGTARRAGRGYQPMALTRAATNVAASSGAPSTGDVKALARLVAGDVVVVVAALGHIDDVRGARVGSQAGVQGGVDLAEVAVRPSTLLGQESGDGLSTVYRSPSRQSAVADITGGKAVPGRCVPVTSSGARGMRWRFGPPALRVPAPPPIGGGAGTRSAGCCGD